MEKTSGALIARLRKEHGMTQLELAEKMAVTDKAVSKWERDLSYPDTASLPKLAEILGVSVDELMQGETAEPAGKQAQQELSALILRAVALAMGTAAAVLGVLGRIDARSGMTMLGLGLACMALDSLRGKQ